VRRSVLLASALTLLPLAACAGEDRSEGSTGGGDPAASSVTIDHVWGSTEVEGTPERVVALGVTDADPVLALGTVPVAAAAYPFFDGSPIGPWAEDLVGSEEPALLESDSDVSVEEIAALQPDLIVAISSGITEQTYDLLSEVAPTLARPAGTAPYTATREQATTMVAAALGQQERGQELVEAADRAFDEATQANPDFDGAVGTVVLPYDDKYGAYTPEDSRGQLMDQLGFELPEGIASRADGTFFVEVSRENLDLVEGDVLLALVDDTTRQGVEDDEVLQGLDVARRGDLIVADDDLRAAVTYNTVLSVPFALDDLTPQLADALAS